MTPFGSEPASTPREQKRETQEVEETRVKAEQIKRAEKTQGVKAETRQPVEMVGTRTADSAMDAQGDFDCDMDVKGEEAGVEDVDHPDQRQVLEQQHRHWVGGLGQTDPSLGIGERV